MATRTKLDKQLDRLRDSWAAPCTPVMLKEYGEAIKGQDANLVEIAVNLLVGTEIMRPSIAALKREISRQVEEENQRQHQKAKKPWGWDDVLKETSDALGKARWQLLRAFYNTGHNNFVSLGLVQKMDGHFRGQGTRMWEDFNKGVMEFRNAKPKILRKGERT